MRLCVNCKTEVMDGEDCVPVYKDEESEDVLDVGQCFTEYNKELCGKEAISRGDILGLCIVCLKPVRQKDRHGVTVLSSLDTSKFEDGTLIESWLTVVPNKNSLHFSHDDCISATLVG